MLIIEDEREHLESGYPMIVPILITERDGDVEIEAYSGIEDIATEFHAKFLDNPFSNAAIDWLDERLEPYANEMGFYRECVGKYRYYESYEADSSKLKLAEVLDSTKRIEDGDYDCLVSYSLMEPIEAGFPGFATVIDGKIVSVATVNEHEEDQRMVEMTVETAKDYRGRGYGRSNAIALAKYLIDNGFSLTYNCSRYNRASQKLARSAGFVKVGRFYAYCAYKQ